MIAPGNIKRNRHVIYSKSFTEVLTIRQTIVLKNIRRNFPVYVRDWHGMQFFNLAQLSDTVHLHLGDPGSVIHIAILTGKSKDKQLMFRLELPLELQDHGVFYDMFPIQLSGSLFDGLLLVLPCASPPQLFNIF